MPSDPMTASELHTLVSQWPQEARPFPPLTYSPPHPEMGGVACWFGTCNPNATDMAHAIALHEASGLRWLLHEWCCSVRICPPEMSDGTAYVIVIGGNMKSNQHTAPTLIEAISAAIMATAKETA
jgi:hypothetical protein